MNADFRILFLGTASFAAVSLRLLCQAGLSPVAVITRPDAKQGRHQRLLPSDVKKAAQELGVPVFQPLNSNTPETAAFFKSFNPSLIVVVAYGQILSKDILQIPQYGCINLHASLLPRYRGASPIVRALLDGVSVTGITTFYMDEGMDTGDIILQKQVSVFPDDDCGILYDRLAAEGAVLLSDTIMRIMKGDTRCVPQNHTYVTYAPKQTKEDARLVWTKPASVLCNQIRAFSPHPGAYTHIHIPQLCERKVMKLFIPTVIMEKPHACSQPGEIISADVQGMLIATGEHFLLVKEIQMEGKRRMSIHEFLNGMPLTSGMMLGS